MTFGIAQLIFVGLMILDLGIALAKNGESKGKYNFGASVVSFIIMMILLNVGGFFG